jgi:FtsZ-binding cell division protein ZapB
MNQAGIDELKAQRNSALDMVANANATIFDLQQALAALQKENEQLKAQNEPKQ